MGPPSAVVQPAGWSSLRTRPQSASITLTERDRRIVALARARLAGAQVGSFSEAVRALREAVEEVIPSGSVFLLGEADGSPVIGSIVSGVGILEDVTGVALVRVGRDGSGPRRLGTFSP